MSVSIRHRYHHSNVIINTEKVVTGNTITANTIPAMLLGGQYWYKPFGGVFDEDSVMKNAQVVKLVNITGFWWNDIGMGNDGYEIPLGHAVKGYLFNERYYIAIKDDRPLHWSLERPATNYHTNNVVRLR